ncbi:MAG TPA: ABC transporter ATP-binding protein [Methylomirabilota bacterium]|nr:ABC transporter ATP-binding protein [Methylomirabilota bacterium]
MTHATDSGSGARTHLEVRDLEVSYSERVQVLRGVSFDVAEGERVGVVGPNGAGKTTLFLALSGVVTPAAGTIRIDGEAVRPGRFRQDVGLVFQNPDHQLFCPTVEEDVAFGPRNLSLAPDMVSARVAAALAETGVTELSDRAPHHLSGGEKRMCSIATVLALEPRLMIYDEPSASLDIRSRRRLIQFLLASPATALVASHDLELVLEVCPRTIVVDDGRIVADGPSREIMDDVALMERHGLERPHSLVPHVVPHHHHHH